MFAGRENIAKITVERGAEPDSQEPREVTATVEVPEGWTADVVTQMVAAASTTTIDVPVTPPGGPPPAGLLAVPTLTAKVTTKGMPVSGAPTAITCAVR